MVPPDRHPPQPPPGPWVMVQRWHDLNVRTYVTLDRRPGIWFFSLDCESTLAVIGARVAVSLPYFRAAMRMRKGENSFDYDSQRWSIAGPPAAFSATYRGVGPPSTPPPASLDHFLTERYCLYSTDGQRIWRADIFHSRWSLLAAEARIDTNSMIAAAGIRAPQHDPVLHYAEFQDVRFWWPVRVR